MKLIDRNYKADSGKILHGVWVPDGAIAGTREDGSRWRLEYLIARYDNEDAKALRKELMKPYETGGRRALLGSRGLPDGEQRRINNEVVGRAVLRDWRIVVMAPDGTEHIEPVSEDPSSPISAENPAVPYTAELGVKQLNALPDWADMLVLASTEHDLFRAAEIEATAKN